MEKIKSIISSLAELDTPDAIAKLKKYAYDIRKNIVNQNNDERIRALELLESFAFRVPEEALLTIEILAKPSLIQPPPEYKHPYRIKGRRHENILEKCLEIARQYNLRYGYFNKSFGILLKFYLFELKNERYEPIRKKAREIILETADYNLKIIHPDGFPFQGYRFQALFVEKIKHLLTYKDEKLFELAINIAERIFKPEVEGTYWEYKTFSIRFGAASYTKSLEKIRKKLMIILFNRAISEKNNVRLLKIINSLANCMSFPTRGKASDKLQLMIMGNIKSLINFYKGIDPLITSPVILQEIEQQLSFQKRRFSQYVGTNIKIAKLLLKESEGLLHKLRNDKFYKLYRIFVGDITDFWDESDNYEQIKIARQKEIETIISSINGINLKKWSNIITRISDTYPLKQHHEFENLFLFSRELGKKKPSLASKLIKSLQKSIIVKSLLTDIVIGIRQSGDMSRADLHVKEWLKSKNIDLIMEIPITYWLIDIALIKSEDFAIFNRLTALVLSKEKREDLDCRILQALPWIYEKNTSQADKILFKILNRVPQKNISFFTRTLTMAQHRNQIDLKKWPLAKIERLINIFLKVDNLDYHENEILAIFVNKNPLGIVDFFAKRIRRRRRTRGEDYFQKYDAIPFSLDELAKVILTLPGYKGIIKKIINEWVIKGDWLLRWEGKHFLYELSPNLDKVLSSEICALIETGKRRKILAAVEVLDAYQGAPIIDTFCKMAIEFSKGDKEIKSVVGRALYQTGVVSGEYGMRDAYKNRLERVKGWDKSKNIYVRHFSNEFSESLNKAVKQEQKRTDEEVMRMKKGVDR